MIRSVAWTMASITFLLGLGVAITFGLDALAGWNDGLARSVAGVVFAAALAGLLARL